jgi:hypothetical protein
MKKEVQVAISRFKEKPKTTEYEGVTIGVRQPTTKEMLEITKARQVYLKTVKDDPYLDGEGEISLFLDLQMETSRLLSCDPEDARNAWFALDIEDQKRLAKSGIERDLAEEVPHKFHSAVWNTLIGADGNAPLETPKTETEVTTTASETTSDSTDLSSKLASISDAQSTKSSDGIGNDSWTESNE